MISFAGRASTVAATGTLSTLEGATLSMLEGATLEGATLEGATLLAIA